MTVVSVGNQELFDTVSAVPGVEAVLFDGLGTPPRPDIEVFIGPYDARPHAFDDLGELHSLKAVQLVTAGYEHVLPTLPAGVVLANGAGIHNTSTSELALALTLAAQRGIPDFVRAAQTGSWTHDGDYPSLADRNVLILGYGEIGRAVARRVLAFEASVTPVASRARAGDDLVDIVHGTDELPALLPGHDVVIVVVPLTDSTRGMVDAQFLAALPDNALIVNVARGKVVQTDALLVECRSGRLRAALDVTDPEPLPADHPLWQLPNVLISPHVGGASSAFWPRARRFVDEQLRRYVAGDGLQHVVSS
ncbi:phosphoglycerate dehydrogenase-like enzyme [Branchiibius hedensis]|uniref:Phosphoglycerate dehydrogenase n=1 Tax=Branchiibius hedensis TaxID=672460 RepID=A0A2Y8ZU28_9MICO|nr:2-hydroxyacid dehydrogenase [Branchiibius hedensis]PWJ24530.1 phosphoglycerate dehydrogenase-like enzyme [Branchiibius hedensis]SSA33347.1 Phosphoglycerate dehydrogenase [Branchiibius hedensis]